MGSTSPGSVSEKRVREISVWSVRMLEVNLAGSQFLGYPKNQPSLSMHRSKRAYGLGFPQADVFAVSLSISSLNFSASGKSPRASEQVGAFSPSIKSRIEPRPPAL